MGGVVDVAEDIGKAAIDPIGTVADVAGVDGVSDVTNPIKVGKTALGFDAAKRKKKALKKAAKTADPFSPFRAQFAQRLVDLFEDPGTVTTSPGYQFRLEQGLKAIRRGGSAKGQRFAGATTADALKFAQGLASQEFEDQFRRLGALSGATTGSPAAAAQLMAQRGSLPSGLETALGRGAQAAGFIFGGPAGGMAAGQATGATPPISPVSNPQNLSQLGVFG